MNFPNLPVTSPLLTIFEGLPCLLKNDLINAVTKQRGLEGLPRQPRGAGSRMSDEHFARASRAAPWGGSTAAVELCCALKVPWQALCLSKQYSTRRLATDSRNVV